MAGLECGEAGASVTQKRFPVRILRQTSLERRNRGGVREEGAGEISAQDHCEHHDGALADGYYDVLAGSVGALTDPYGVLVGHDGILVYHYGVLVGGGGAFVCHWGFLVGHDDVLVGYEEA